jgi:hypothetical protein
MSGRGLVVDANIRSRLRTTNPLVDSAESDSVGAMPVYSYVGRGAAQVTS